MPEKEMGVVGLATMGMNLARNLASHGVRVAVYNRTRQRTDEFMSSFSKEGDFHAAYAFEDLKRILQPPRAVLVMVKAGAPVDESIDSLTKVLEKGDTIIDGGNSLFQDTQRRAAAVEKVGLGYIGSGVSGGEEGALHGPSLMPGGTHHSYRRVEEMLNAIAAKVDGVPCCAYIGPDGAGHFVKMVHNGIEYADIQLIAETYDLLRHALGVPLTGITEAVFARMLSSQKERRLKAAGILAGPAAAKAPSGLVDDIQEALYASKIVAYAQGFEHLAAGSNEHRWNLDLGALA